MLPKPFRDAHFAFYGTELSGTPQQRPRDVNALNATSGALQDAVGKAYVDKYFPASAKAEIQTMVENLKNAFAKRVEAIDWMAPSTKQEALKKVHNIVVGVGYPDSWRDYGGVQITADNAYANAKNAGLAEYKFQIAKIGKPMDRKEWWMPPQLVNAVNLPVQNALNFPAAILVKPFFDPDRRRRLQLWRNRIGHRPRNQPQFRQWRRLVRCFRCASQLVDPGRLQAVPASCRRARRAIRPI